MRTNIQKWGNSLGVRIPKHLAEQLALQENITVDVCIENGRIVIQKDKYNLQNMLDLITSENIHSSEFDDKAIGSEEW